MYDLIKLQVDQLKSDERNGAALSPIDFELIDLYENYLQSKKSKYELKAVIDNIVYDIKTYSVESFYEQNLYRVSIIFPIEKDNCSDELNHVILITKDKKSVLYFNGKVACATPNKIIFYSKIPPAFYI